jgi:diguanylate cyclase (GGDEF)-like protein
LKKAGISKREQPVLKKEKHSKPFTTLKWFSIGGLLGYFVLHLDNFKQYNDAHGHIAGDKVLAKGGEILKQSLRKTDSAYRYGGEEFAVVLPESSGKDSLYFAERIRQAFESQNLLIQQEKNLCVTVSIGVAQYISGEEITTFIKRSDQNMYAAKHKGKNRVYF